MAIDSTPTAVDQILSTAPTVIDLFCGAGGLSLGFGEAGFQNLLSIDNTTAAVETFSANLSGPVRCEEITEESDLPRATVVIGGPPCQGFSSAGMRRTGDARNTLVSVFAQLVARSRPDAFVFENVEGFLTADGGSRVRDLLEPLLGAGYRIHVRKVNAANYGVPQHRKRVIALGGLGFDPSFPDPTHSAFGAPGAHLAAAHLPLAPTVADVLGDLPAPAGTPPGDPPDHYARPLTASRLGQIRGLGPGHTMRDLPRHYWHESYRRRAYRRVMDGTPTERRGGPPAGIRRLHPDEPSKAITGGALGEFIHPSQDRFLTIRECARLQTFPDSFRLRGTKAERTTLIGNAVPPKLAAVLACRLAEDLRARHTRQLPGALLSFVPTLSNGMSPALDLVIRMVEARFTPPNTQLMLLEPCP